MQYILIARGELNMQIFKINEEIQVVCESKPTRTAFKHVATLMKNGYQIDETKICYENRTWERYTFENVLQKLLDKTKALTEEEKAQFEKVINKDNTDNSMLKTTQFVAKLGDIFTDTKKESNDWKLRMLKAGLENKGLNIPKDWETLSEEEKEKRLNQVIKIMGE
jgi:hypothetical protein